jgi:hypothetical protein
MASVAPEPQVINIAPIDSNDMPIPGILNEQHVPMAPQQAVGSLGLYEPPLGTVYGGFQQASRMPQPPAFVPQPQQGVQQQHIMAPQQPTQYQPAQQ